MLSCSAPIADRRRSLLAVALVVAGLVLTGCHGGTAPPPGAAAGAPYSRPVRVASFGPSFSGVAADGLGALWWAGSGMWRFDPASGVLRNYTADDDVAFATQWRTVPSVLGGVWVLDESQARRFDGERFAPALPTPVEFCRLAEGVDGALFGVSCDTNGLVAGVYRWGEGRWEPLDLDLEGVDGSLELLGVEPSDGLWFQAYGAPSGLVHWDDGAWAAYPTANGVLLGGGPVAMATGGGVWAAAEGVVARFTQAGWTPPIPDSGLTYVASMAEAGGTLWVAGTEQDPWAETQQGDAVPVVVAGWDGTSWTRYGPESGLDLVGPNLGFDISLSAAGGRVWAAGREGLFRLDGERWTHVLPATAPAFAERMVVTGPDEAWVVDRGVLWRVKGGRWSLAPRVGLLSNAVVDLAQGPDGALWAATASGLARLADGRWRDVADVRSLTGRATGFAGFASVTVAPDGAVWALEDDGRVVRIGDGVSVPQPAVALGGDLQVAADGTVWAAGYSWEGGGGVKRRGADGRWTPEYPWGKGPVTESCNTDLAVAQGDGWAVRRCWAGVLGEEEGAELAQFDGAGWTVHHDADGRPFGSIAGIAVTPQGSLIVAADSGLLAHDTAGWTRLLPDSYASVAVAPDGALWLTDPSGVSRYVP